MKWGRIYLALLMFTAIIFRSLPDTIFDYFHEHVHTHQLIINNQESPTIHEEAHDCHMVDWNFESNEILPTIFIFYTPTSLSEFLPSVKQLGIFQRIQRIGRAPPVLG